MKSLRLALLADAAHVNCQIWCEGLSQAGAEVHVLSFGGNVPKANRNHLLSMPKLPAKLHYFAAAPSVRQLINEIKPDVVAAYYITGYGTLGALTGFHPLVQVTSGSDILLAPDNLLMRRVLRFNLDRADLVTAWAPHMAERAHQLGVAENRIFVLPRGIPSGRFGRMRSSPPRSNEEIRIISTRSFKGDYHVGLLLDAIHCLSRAGRSPSITLAGDGPLREQVMRQTADLGLERAVRFAGFVPNEELPAQLAQHNLYISLVASDGVSASLLEAMATGLLPIVPNHPANRLWITSGKNGLLLDDLSPQAIADAIVRGIENVSLRQRAWRENLEIVRKRADLYCNSEVFVERFRQLAVDCRN